MEQAVKIALLAALILQSVIFNYHTGIVQKFRCTLGRTSPSARNLIFENLSWRSGLCSLMFGVVTIFAAILVMGL
jgi:hypothetical protein